MPSWPSSVRFRLRVRLVIFFFRTGSNLCGYVASSSVGSVIAKNASTDSLDLVWPISDYDGDYDYDENKLSAEVANPVYTATHTDRPASRHCYIFINLCVNI